MSDIAFPVSVPTYCAADLTLTCPAMVDGDIGQYSITAEALKEHFGARSHREADLMHAFTTHRVRIESIAKDWFEDTQARQISLHCGHVRFAA